MYESLNLYHYFIDEPEESNNIYNNIVMLDSEKLEKLKEIENVILEIADY